MLVFPHIGENDGRAVHPGAISDTRLGRFIPEQDLKAFKESAIYTWKSVPQGAATTVYVATAPELANRGGRYFEDCHEAAVLGPDTDIAASGFGVAYWAVDENNAEQLWELSNEMFGNS